MIGLLFEVEFYFVRCHLLFFSLFFDFEVLDYSAFVDEAEGLCDHSSLLVAPECVPGDSVDCVCLSDYYLFDL